MNVHNAHITVDGKPLCHNHGHLLGDPIGSHGNRITCDYDDHRKAREAHKHLRARLVNANVRLKGGPCPLTRDGDKK